MGVIEDQERIDRLIQRNRLVNQASDDYMMRKARANLFMDQDSMIEYLASERFPNDPMGAYRYVVKEGDLYYQDPNGEFGIDGITYSQEFPDLRDYGIFADNIVPNIMPTATFVADVSGGIAGAKKGFEKGLQLAARGPKNPWVAGATILSSTAAGGFGGNLMIGAIPRGANLAMIDQFYNVSPEELAASIRDLGISSGFSAIPFGTGPTRRVVNKFLGKEETLNYLVQLRGETDEIIQEARRFGFDLTPAEAAEIGGKGAQIQHFLSAQPQITKINNFYGNRASQVREAIEVFADEIGSGKTVGDINTRIKVASDFLKEELHRRRKMRARKIYDYIKTIPGGVKVDNVDKLVSKIDDALAGKIFDPQTGELVNTIKVSDETIKNLTKLRNQFFDADGNIIDDLSSLDQRRTTGMQKLFKKVLKQGTDDVATVGGIMSDLTALMDEAEPLYRKARKAWDPNKPSILNTEMGAIGRIANAMTDKQTATAMKNLFDPNVSVQSLRNAKRLLSTVDPDTFKDVKKEFILQNLDKMTRMDQIEQGLPAFQRFMSKTNINKMMEVMLEPDEFAQWSRMTDLMGRAFSVTKGGSPTQPFQAIEEIISREGQNLTSKGINATMSLVNLPGRILSGQIGDDLVKSISSKQTEAYMQKLADLLVDPDAAKTIDEIYNIFEAGEYAVKQIGTRGVVEGAEAVTDDDVRPYMGTPMTEGLRGQIQDFQMPQVDAPLFEPEADLAPQEMLSPTILPSEKDREIASRQLGIGSLA